MFNPSPIQSLRFNDHNFYLKRDDLLHPQFSGNKARKFYHFLVNDLPGITYLVGSGSAQANSLYSLAALAQLKDLQCDFYVDHIPSQLRQNPCGNYQAALALGVNIIDVSEITGQQQRNLDAFMQRQIKPTLLNHQLLIPEGGRCHYAREGVQLLGQEIEQWQIQRDISHLNIMLPAGTGTTALYLSEYFHQRQRKVKVLSCACVGNEAYLSQQFSLLNPDSNCHPQILPRRKNYHFGKLYRQLYQLWLTLIQQSQVEFDLLYDPIGWQCLIDFLDKQEETTPTLYIHQGGLLGNQSMLPRYQRKYPDLTPI
ncbi:pyridoxal-phosphate dependent enzyme [Agarivorans sp. QJM3NY_25]|uniref:pyridoxal-phosphate dependent enzyme n=1 Tax=Agarivorans sp. QJM3NY_25 TaxID=3421430 RepID=UPI003D7CEB8C